MAKDKSTRSVANAAGTRAEGASATGLLAHAFRRAVLRRQDSESGVEERTPALAAAKSVKPTPAPPQDKDSGAAARSAQRKRAKVRAMAAKRKKAAKAKAATVASAHGPGASPLAPKIIVPLPPLAGVELSTAAAGIRYKGRDDVMVALLAPGTSVGGVFTTSRMPGAPIDWAKANLSAGGKAGPSARALVVNAGNANVFTGKAGREAVERVAASAAKLASVQGPAAKAREIFLASTGVIGEPFPAEKLEAVLAKLWRSAKGDAAAWTGAARAIMTTDTFPKTATRVCEIAGTKVRINGIAKGSGMIAPDMATMLSFIFTDAALPSDILQTLLVLGVRDTFNATTVDSDTSTSDTVLLFATGKGPKHEPITRAGDPRLREFRTQLHDLMGDLAKQVVRDGEGATKFVTVDVTGAASAKAARCIALSIANSPLVKTALAASDANWGRIVAAVGKSGELADRDRLAIRMAGHLVAEKGARAGSYDEAKISAAMKAQEISVEVDVGIGSGRATIYTCDLTHGYISINGSYRS